MSITDRRYKVIFLGETGVGKTALMERYCLKTPFREFYGNTFGVDTLDKKIDVDGETLNLTFWVPAVPERRRQLVIKSLYRNVSAAVFIYDISKKSSFDRISNWIEEAERNGMILGTTLCFLLANKCDMASKSAVPKEKAKKLAEKYKFIFYETSVKLDDEFDNLDEIFLSLGRILKFSEELRFDKEIIRVRHENVPRGNSCDRWPNVWMDIRNFFTWW